MGENLIKKSELLKALTSVNGNSGIPELGGATNIIVQLLSFK